MIYNLNNITSKLYDIINDDKDIESKKNLLELKSMITDYHKNIENINTENTDKMMYYNIHYNNPRIIQDKSYDDYLIQRNDIYEELIKDFNIITIRKIINFSNFNYNDIPDIYSYNIEVNKNFKEFNIEVYNNKNPLNIDNHINENENDNDIDFEIQEEKKQQEELEYFVYENGEKKEVRKSKKETQSIH